MVSDPDMTLASLNPDQGSPPYPHLSCWRFSCRGISAEPENSLQATFGLQINLFVPSPLDGLHILIWSIFFNLEISPKKEKSRSLAILEGKKIRKSANTGPTFLPYKMDWSWVVVYPFKQGTCSPVHHQHLVIYQSKLLSASDKPACPGSCW